MPESEIPCDKRLKRAGEASAAAVCRNEEGRLVLRGVAVFGFVATAGSWCGVSGVPSFRGRNPAAESGVLEPWSCELRPGVVGAGDQGVGVGDKPAMGGGWCASDTKLAGGGRGACCLYRSICVCKSPSLGTAADASTPFGGRPWPW